MTRIEAEWLSQEATQRVLTMLTEGGHDAFVVGGCVRNTLLNAPVADIDVSTSAAPQEVVDLAEKSGLKAVPTGIDHGTVTVVCDHHPFEVTTFRRDVETDGRRAVVEFSSSVAEDAARRDFTMNALYARADGSIVDPLGGMTDLLSRRVRFVGNPADRIEEDYLRALRYFRFHAQYGDPYHGVDTEALTAIAQHLDGIARLPAERIGAEMIKLLSASDPSPSVAAMEQSGVLMRVLPGASSLAMAPLVHFEHLHGAGPDPIRRLAVLGGEDADDRLRLSRRQRKQLADILRFTGTPVGEAEIAWRGGAGLAWDVALARAALTAVAPSPDVADRVRAGASAEFPLSAADLMPEVTGSALGEALSRAERAWIDSEFSLNRDALIGIARKPG